ncbi:MAG TPA: hypothetical protein VFG42_19625 [Baekduia sp.]|uniref:hypothetical protein n=1 Tax=Baekduia sp. TaxID=2600305 RepID=UPI002D799745|nr:hypothetical protein [Baekduia sp.]HET6509013.1 hypothetical protein [Baekduia sp.]
MTTVHELRQPLIGDTSGLWGGLEYTTWQDEQLSWKTDCYIGDWTFLWEWRFTGPEALKLIADHSVNSFATFAVGQAKHTIQCDERGQIIHEGIVLRLGEEEFLSFGMGGFYLAHRLRAGGYDAEAVSEDWFNYQVSGPKALFAVEAAAGQSLRDVKFMHAGDITIAGHRVKAMRQGMAGEIGYELIGAREHGDDVYQAVLAAGQPFGIRRMGARVAMINHLEACFPTLTFDYVPAIHGTPYYAELEAALPFLSQLFRVKGSFEGTEIADWYRNPVELGWGRNVKFDHDFVGRDALQREVTAPRREIVTLRWNADDVTDVYRSQLSTDGPRYQYMEIPRDLKGYMWADRVLLPDGTDVGVSTSRGFSEYFKEMLSLCTIDVAHTEPGTEVVVVWGDPGSPQKEIRATVAPAPYKTDNRRADVSALQAPAPA